MRSLLAVAACAATIGWLQAQEPTKPYREGDVHEFLVQARQDQRPAVVLFNFNLESG